MSDRAARASAEKHAYLGAMKGHSQEWPFIIWRIYGTTQARIDH